MSANGDLTDRELLLLLKQGDMGAFDLIYRKYVKQLLNAAYKRLASADEAEDLVQDIFVSLHARRADLDDSLNLVGYLMNAVKYKVFNIYRNKITQERYASLVQNNKVSRNRIDPLSVLEAKELAMKIRSSTSNLPEKCRQAFILSRSEHLSNKLIALKMGISVSTVEQHITKALKMLKEDFKGYDQGLIIILVLIYCQ